MKKLIVVLVTSLLITLPVLAIFGKKVQKHEQQCNWGTESQAKKKMNEFIDNLPKKADHISGNTWEMGPTCDMCPSTYCFQVYWTE